MRYRPVTHDKVEVEGGFINYEDIGKGTPLVLIHAGYVDSRMWDNQIGALKEKYRVIRYDVRGYGKSTRTEQAYCDAEDLKKLLDHLEIRKAVILGVSNGGRIAFDFAVSYPQMVMALIPVDSGLKGYKISGPEEEKLWEHITIDEEKYLSLRKEGKFREAAAIDVDFWSNAATGKLRDYILEIAEENVFSDETDPDRLQVSPSPPAFERLSSLKVPVLFIVGSLDTPPLVEMDRRIHVMIPGSKFVVIEGADHLPSLTRPKEFRKTLLGFLETL